MRLLAVIGLAALVGALAYRTGFRRGYRRGDLTGFAEGREQGRIEAEDALLIERLKLKALMN